MKANRTKHVVDKSLGGRKEKFLVGKTCTYRVANAFRYHPKFFLIHLQNSFSTRTILAFFRALKPAKHMCFLIFQLLFG